MQNGPELSSPLVVSTRSRQTVTIYCAEVNTDGSETVRGLHWRFPNNSRVPEVNIARNRSEYDVGMARYRENNRWIGLLHMNRALLPYAGIYKCVADFSGVPKNRSIEIQVSGGCPQIYQHTPWGDECYMFAVCIIIMYVVSNIAPTWAGGIFK